MADISKIQIESGTYNIKDAYLREKAVQYYDTLADLKNSTNLVENSIIKTLGRNNINDKLGNYFLIREKGVSETADEIKLIALTDTNLIAEVIENNYYSTSNFAGETEEDRLHEALNTITFGVIECGNVNITKVYNALAKDYRYITIKGGTFTINYNEWFNQENSSYKSVPNFIECNFKGNLQTDNTIYNNNYQCVGATFNGCIFDNVRIYNSSVNYLQSPYFIGCLLFNVSNFITANVIYDLKMIGCKVESASGKLVVVTDRLMQGSVDSSLIEGRTDVVFEINSIYALTIENCYFESNNGGLVSQTGSNAGAMLVVRKNAFFGNQTNTNYAINISTGAKNNVKISDNICNFIAGKYLCNVIVEYADSFFTHQNENYNTEFANNGFPLMTNGTHNEIVYKEKSAVWDEDRQAWKISIKMPYEQIYSWCHPFEIIFAGSYSGSNSYQGYAIVRVCPRIAYSGGLILVCDTTVVDSCNKNNVSKSSSVTASAETSTTAYSGTSLTIDVYISGFTSARGKYQLHDLFRMFNSNTF